MNISEEKFILESNVDLDNEFVALLHDIDLLNEITADNVTEFRNVMNYKITFKFRNYFVKAFYVGGHIDRMTPYSNLNGNLDAISLLTENNIPMPGYLGKFAVADREGHWTINGIIFENLTEYHTLEEAPDYEMARAVANALAEKKIYHADFNLSNIMTNGTDWKLIDFDKIETIDDSTICFVRMISRCINIANLKDLPNKAEIKETMSQWLK